MAAKTTTTPVYDESKIKTLSSIEHIRARTGMYIGRTGNGAHYDDGIYVLLKEVIDNGIDEHIMGHGKRIEITLDGQDVTIRDYGRGIPHGKLVECVSQINTGAKYNSEVFQFSVGLNGVGTKAVNALSTSFTVASYREGRFAEATFEKGVLISQDKGAAKDQPDGTLVSFTPDPDIFKNYAFREEFIIRRLKFYCYLNAGLEIRFNGQSYKAADGLLDLIEEEMDADGVYPPLHYEDKTLEIAFTHTNLYSENHYSFVNGQYTVDGGTHLSAFREGILKAFNSFSKKNYEGEDVREGLVGAIAIRLQDPIFESQTKNKLGNADIRSDLVNKIKTVVEDLLHKNPKAAERSLLKIEETQKLRREIQSVKKLAREKSKNVSIRVPQLKDCKKHLDLKREKGQDTQIFITEGQSAAGSLVSCRDVNTQAIFTLKGKPLNVADLNRDSLYKNDELYNLMQALNIEESVDTLRYQQVIMATDADVDGMHIRNLLMTYFLRYFPELVRDNHLFILETPLFRVRNRKETVYCYSEAERDKASERLKTGLEITRFKGLGEISPDEFKHFIGPNMRLAQVTLHKSDQVKELLEYYMGKNTMERQNFIIDNLVIEEDIPEEE